MEQGGGEIVADALTAIAPVAFTSGLVVVRVPWIDSLALALGTLEGTIFPSQRMNIGWTLFGVAELVDVREPWH
jgi:hypothetical protein